MTENKQITRKDFLKGMGMTVAGVAVTGSLTGILTGCSTEAAAPAAAVAVDTSQAPAWPFKYAKIDVAAAQEKAYKGYKEKGG